MICLQQPQQSRILILADLLVDLLVDPLVDPLVDSLVDSLVDPQRAYAKVFPSLPVNTKENQPES